MLGGSDVKLTGGAMEITFPLITKNPLNGSQGMTRAAILAKARKAKQQRATTRDWIALGLAWQRKALLALLAGGVKITLIRLAPSKGLDKDNLGAALKHVQDGVTDALGLTNDNDPRIDWHYDQERSQQGAYAVRIRFEKRGTDERRDKQQAAE